MSLSEISQLVLDSNPFKPSGVKWLHFTVFTDTLFNIFEKIKKCGLDQYGADCFGIDSFLPQSDSEKLWDSKG